MKPNLSQEFKQACSRSLKLGEFLFGNNLPETLKTLRATSRIVSAATKTNDPQQNFRMNKNFQPRPFLGQRGRMQHLPRIQYHQSPYSHKEIHKELENAKKQVIDFELVQDNVLTYLSSQVKDFHAGQLSEHLSDWKSTTSSISSRIYIRGKNRICQCYSITNFLSI